MFCWHLPLTMLGPGMDFAGVPLASTLGVIALVQGRQPAAAALGVLLSAGSLAWVMWLITRSSV